jgi:hypothetical protein
LGRLDNADRSDSIALALRTLTQDTLPLTRPAPNTIASPSPAHRGPYTPWLWRDHARRTSQDRDREPLAAQQAQQAEDGAVERPFPHHRPGRRVRAGHPAQRRQREAMAGLLQLQAITRQHLGAGFCAGARCHDAAALVQALEALPRAPDEAPHQEEPRQVRAALCQGQRLV